MKTFDELWAKYGHLTNHFSIAMNREGLYEVAVNTGKRASGYSVGVHKRMIDAANSAFAQAFAGIRAPAPKPTDDAEDVL